MSVISEKQLNSVFERIIKDKNGILVRVRFTVVEIGGKFQGQIISAETLVSKVENVIYLPITKNSKVIVSDTTLSFISKISPYFSLDFFMSQPTRAPAFPI